MALIDNAWYVNFGNGSSTGYYAIAQWAAATAYTAGQIRRQLATPAFGQERVFVCIVAGTSGGSEPAWVLTRGAKTTDNTVTWQECSGIAALNSDITNTPSWSITSTPPGGVKNTAVTLGQVIKRDNGASYQICSTAGTAGNAAEPAFSNTAGTTTTDNTVTWTSLGPVGNWTAWMTPHCRLNNVCQSNWSQAGNKIYVASGQLETGGNTATLNTNGSQANPVYILCASTAGSIPPVAADLRTDGEIATTGNSVIGVNGACYIYGIIFHGGKTGAISGGGLSFTGTVETTQILDNCTLRCSGTGAMSMTFGGAVQGNRTILNNTTVAFASVSGNVSVNGDVIWKNTPNAVLGTIPTNFFTQISGGRSSNFTCIGVDLSAIGAGKTLVPNGSGTANVSRWLFLDCKLDPAVTRYTTPFTEGGMLPEFIRCGATVANYTIDRPRYSGTLTNEQTIIRTGGSTDGNTPISWKVVTNANAKWILPFECPPLVVFNNTIGSPITLTVEGIWSGGAVPNNDDIWMEVEYLSSNSSMLGTWLTGTKDNFLAAIAAQPSSSATWGGSTTPYKLQATITPQQKGLIYAYVKCAKPSTTFYVDPLITIT